MTRQRTLPKKIPLTYDRDRCFFTDLGYNGEPHLALLHIEDRVGVVSLREYRLLFRDRQDLTAVANGREESIGVECAVSLGCYRGLSFECGPQKAGEGTETVVSYVIVLQRTEPTRGDHF